MTSLLGKFYTRIIGSQEDIASEGLAYILQKSATARRVFANVMQIDGGEDVVYTTQSVGDKLERPDISGKKHGREVVLIEAKFWASLTDNQPSTYLERLGEGTVLMLVCPDLRVRPIYNELKYRLQNSGQAFTHDDERHCFHVEPGKRLIVKTWREILESIRDGLRQDHDHKLLSDIDQIIGLCETIDAAAFVPYQSEDFSPATAKKICSFYHIVDKVIDELVKRDRADLKGMRSAGQYCGYTRYFKVDTFACALHVFFDNWKSESGTFFWLGFFEISDDGWKQTDEFKAKIQDIAGKFSLIPFERANFGTLLPLRPPLNENEDRVVAEIANQITVMIGMLK